MPAREDDDLTIQEPSGGRVAIPKLTGERYRLGPPISKGGMGEVLEAEDTQLGRHVAVKRMLAKDPTDRSIARFIREAQIQGRLDHPSIVPVHEIGRDKDGRPFFAMKKVAGITLGEILDNDGLSATYSQQKLLRAFTDVCLAVELAHTKGIIHRDLKPSNIMLGDFGEVYVLDWGVAKIVGVPDEESSDSSDDNLTMSGAAIGTPGFMAPEQIRDASSVDARSDVYALGCMLYEILTRTPLHPRGRSGLNSALAGADARPSERAPDVAPELDVLCVEATQTDADERRITARELADRVQEYLDGDRDLERRNAVAREHLDAARKALSGLDTNSEAAARAIAMREAGRALALDPKLSSAAEIVTRLMLEPPRALPRDVESEIAAKALETDRRHAKISLLLLTGYLVFIPYLIFSTPWYIPTAFGLVVGLQLAMLRKEMRSPRFRVPLSIARNTILILIISRAFGPFLLAPGIAAMTASALLLSSAFERLRSAILLVVAFSLAVIIPWIAELSGLIPPTMLFSSQGLAFVYDEQPASWIRQTGLVAYVVGLVAAGAAITWPLLNQERSLRRQLYLQTWQLKQLVS